MCNISAEEMTRRCKLGRKGLGRAVLGLQQALTVRIRKENNETRDPMGQAKWADKAGVEVIGALVFWPLMIPATVGVYKQSQLPGKIQAVIQDYVSSQGKTATVDYRDDGCLSRVWSRS